MNRSSRFLIMTLVSGALAVGDGLRAQAPGKPPQGAAKTYSNEPVFALPIVVDVKNRSLFREVRLYCKHEPGEWVLQQSAPPTQTYFSCRASQDGEYWFTGVCVDQAGNASPADVSRRPPDLVLVVDTQAPQVEVRPYTLGSGKPSLRLLVHDANPDPRSVKLEYRGGDLKWRALEALSQSQDVFLVPQPEILNGWVRASAVDRAGNKTAREINLRKTALHPDIQTVAHTETVRVDSREDKIVARAEPLRVDSRADKMAANPEPLRFESRIVPREKTKVETVKPGAHLINTTRASLSYQIVQLGPSGVGKVEVWITKDMGQTWQRLCEDTAGQTSVAIDLPGEGIYGLSLVISNGSGFGKPPPAESADAELWVEVDATKPVAQLKNVQPVNGSDTPTIYISWSASDKNLGTEPVELYYATRHGGPWLPIAQGLNKEGNYRWPVPRHEGPQFYVRLVVNDQAGNRTYSETQEPLLLDLLMPKTRGVRIDPIAPRPSLEADKAALRIGPRGSNEEARGTVQP